MKILFLGDVVGRSGREIVLENIPKLRAELKLDAVIVNVDNASAGFGVTAKNAEEFLQAGADILTGGDHIWDQKCAKGYMSSQPRLLRPANFPDKTAGKGHYILELANGQKLLVIHVLGQVFHKENLDCPFAKIDEIISSYRLGKTVDAILVDAHAEATSEKTAFGQYLDGRVSVVVGSHTHIPTADSRILPNGTAYQTDAGMCGVYNSVIGFDSASPIARFTTKINKNRLEVLHGDATLCGLYVETDRATGLAKKVRAIKFGGVL